MKHWIRLLPWLRPSADIVRALTTPLGRGQLRAVIRGARLYQPATTTRENRHPAIFEFVAGRLASLAAPRILSFGCSTGEEAFTLARYVTRAKIDAIDANPTCIARAIHMAGRIHMERVTFHRADTPDVVAPATYDAVICLSVLRHGDLDAFQPEFATKVFPFSKYAAAIEALDRRVSVGGLLVLWGCHFRLSDTPTASRYRAVPIRAAKPEAGVLYGPDSRLLETKRYPVFAYIKQVD